MSKKKKKHKRKYNPNKHKKPPTRAAATVSPIFTNMGIINHLKPVMEAAQRARERAAERENTNQ